MEEVYCKDIIKYLKVLLFKKLNYLQESIEHNNQDKKLYVTKAI